MPQDGSVVFAIDFDFQLGERADELRQAVREFAQRRIAPQADEIDRSNRFPRELWPEMGAMGLLGMTVPEEYGGLGFGYLEHVVAMPERDAGQVFANICVQKHMNRFTVRTKRKVDVQWRLFALVHNIGKIHTFGTIH